MDSCEPFLFRYGTATLIDTMFTNSSSALTVFHTDVEQAGLAFQNNTEDLRLMGAVPEERFENVTGVNKVIYGTLILEFVDANLIPIERNANYAGNFYTFDTVSEEMIGHHEFSALDGITDETYQEDWYRGAVFEFLGYSVNESYAYDVFSDYELPLPYYSVGYDDTRTYSDPVIIYLDFWNDGGYERLEINPRSPDEDMHRQVILGDEHY